MNTLLNTSFFFSPDVAARVRRELSGRWVPACAACGVSAPVCLQMDPEQGIARLAVQTAFADRAAAAAFLDRIAGPLAAELTVEFGAERFTSFSTLMDVVDL